MLEGLCGCIIACNLWLTGPAEFHFWLHCDIAESAEGGKYEFFDVVRYCILHLIQPQILQTLPNRKKISQNSNLKVPMHLP